MSLSVIIPVFNEENYLEKTLESVKNQIFKDFELIVVCNGCTDSSFEIAKKYTSNVFKIKEKNVSKAKNFGASKAKNEFLIFLDADVLMNSDVFNKVHEIMFKDKFYGTVKGKGKGFKNSSYLRFKNLVNNFKPWSHGFVFCDKKSFLEVEGFNSNLLKGELKDFFSKAKGNYKRVNVYVEPNDRRVKQWGLWKVTMYWLLGRDKKDEYEAVR
ncbi:MAG: hypothetical protein CMH63_03390 [Nanoarchaeota archaeon]|jgi:glycosyltransferase involved in cell wall biosynthesis|nr:hypothetical protein [Nanoarchaeota archaeon]|tara:strand:- start:10236 stop:10874 length:639 start_codon:yes stop_codon:yes gene_type:complete